MNIRVVRAAAGLIALAAIVSVYMPSPAPRSTDPAVLPSAAATIVAAQAAEVPERAPLQSGAAPAFILSAPSGQLAGANGVTLSANWSGYALAGQNYTAIQGTWTVPAVSYTAANAPPPLATEYSAIWLGIGGLADATLIQLGTEQDISANGSTNYYAWYQMLPGNQIPLGLDYPVSPGDVITAALRCTAGCTANGTQTWAFTLTNATQGWTWTDTPVPYASSLASAEWIAEAPTKQNQIQALPNYGSVAFTNLSANGANPPLTSSNAIVLNDPFGQVSTPAPPSAGNSFAINFSSDVAAPDLVSAVLPASRSAVIGSPVTAFSTVINSGNAAGTVCGLSLDNFISAIFSYQTTDPTTNQVTGTINTPVDIAPGASQSYVFAITPQNIFSNGSVQVPIAASCSNGVAAPTAVGINTLSLSVSKTPVPDIVALAASGDPGFVDIPGADGSGAFAVATVNLGIGATITAAANTGSAKLPITLAVCQTNPTSGACLAAPSSSVTTDIPPNATPTFGIFATGSGPVADLPGLNRVFVTFTDSGGALRGETSVAVRTQ